MMVLGGLFVGLSIFDLLMNILWWILGIFGVLVAAGEIFLIFSQDNKGTHGAQTHSEVNISATGETYDKCQLYWGSTTSGSITVAYRDGKIFDEYNPEENFSRIVANYSNGFVYKGSLSGMANTVIGRYRNGRIYRGNSTSEGDLIGKYVNGNIYTDGIYSVTGKYTGDDEGGAAAAIYCLF